MQIALGLLLLGSVLFSNVVSLFGGVMLLGKGLKNYGALWLLSQLAIIALGIFVALLVYAGNDSKSLAANSLLSWVNIVAWSIFAVLAVSVMKLWKRGVRSYASWGCAALVLGWVLPSALNLLLS